jgi:hypothetical protein
VSTNVTSNVGGSPQVLRGTPVGGEDIQHVAIADPTGAVPGATSGAISANGGTVVADCAGLAGVSLKVTGTWTGTLVFETSVNGTDYDSIYGVVPTLGITNQSASNNRFNFTLGGQRWFRVRASVWTSGTATVDIRSAATGQNVTVLTQANAPVFARLTDGTAAIDAATTAPTGTERALITRPIQSGVANSHQVRPAGAVQKVVMIEGEAGIQADTLVTTAILNSAGTVTTGQTSIPVTANKTFRVIALQLTVYATSATTPPWIRVKLRFNPTAAAVIGSPQYLSLVAGPSAAFVNSSSAIDIDTPNGIVELTAGGTAGGFAFSKSGPATTPTNSAFNLTLSGYEY